MGRERRDIVALYNIAVAVGSSLSLKKVIWRLYEEAGQSIDLSNFAVVIYDEKADLLNFYLVFDRGERVKPFTLRHSTNPGLISQVITTQSQLLVEDLPQTNHISEINEMQPGKAGSSWLGVPFLNSIVPNENAQGVLAIWSYRSQAISQRDVWFLSEIATQAAIAIRNAHLFEASQRRALEIAVINDVAQAVSSTLDLDEVLSRIMDQVEGMLNVSGGFLLLKEPASDDLVFQIALGERADNVESFRIPAGHGIAGQVATTGQPIMVNRKERDIEFNADNALCVPLISHEQVIGVLEVLNKKEGHFSQHDTELLSSIAAFAAIAVENARLHESVLDERDRVIEAEEEARKELARTLHDGPIQLVAGIVMRLNFCETAMTKNPALLEKEIPLTMDLADQAMHQMRTTLFELRPLVLETEGLVAALDVFLKRQQKDLLEKQPTRLSLEIKPDPPQEHISRQERKVEAAIFAIVQEAVTNAVKHAGSRYIQIHLKETPVGLYVTVSDDGIGFDVNQVMNSYAERGSLGMVNVRERADLVGGDLKIQSSPEKGTKLRIYIPKEKDERRRNRTKTGRLSTSPLGKPGNLSRSSEPYGD